MPFNKFGNFLYHTTKPHRLSAHQYSSISQGGVEEEQVEGVEKYKSICVVSLRGTRRDDSLFYHFFENTSKTYTFQFDGIIKDIHTSTENIMFHLNDGRGFTKNEMLGKSFKREDNLSIIRKHDSPPDNTITIQFIFLCPLIK